MSKFKTWVLKPKDGWLHADLKLNPENGISYDVHVSVIIKYFNYE